MFSEEGKGKISLRQKDESVKESKQIVIKGFFGVNNIGDEAILTVMLDDIRSGGFLFSKVVVFSHDPVSTANCYKVKVVNARWSKNLIGIIKTIKDSDIFVLGAGGLFPNDSFPNIFFTLLPLFLSRISKSLTLVYAVGIDPIRKKTSQWLVRLVFSHCVNAVSVRDEESRECIEKIGVRLPINVCTDPAVLLTPDEKAATEMLQSLGLDSKSNFVVVALGMPWDLSKEKCARTRYEQFTKGFALFTDRFLSAYRDVRVIFIPFFWPGDKYVADDILLRVKLRKRVAVVESPIRPEIVKALIAKADLLVGMRFHSLLFAASVGTPMIAISYAPKCESLMKKCNLLEYSVHFGIRKSEFFKEVRDIDFEEIFLKLKRAYDIRGEIKVMLNSLKTHLIKEACPINELIQDLTKKEECES